MIDEHDLENFDKAGKLRNDPLSLEIVSLF